MSTALQIAQLQTRLDAYLTAEQKILKRQEYVVGDGSTRRTVRYADLREVQQTIADLQQQINSLQAQASGRSRIVYARPAN